MSYEPGGTVSVYRPSGPVAVQPVAVPLAVTTASETGSPRLSVTFPLIVVVVFDAAGAMVAGVWATALTTLVRVKPSAKEIDDARLRTDDIEFSLKIQKSRFRVKHRPIQPRLYRKRYSRLAILLRAKLK
jgi:hypothetical protein